MLGKRSWVASLIVASLFFFSCSKDVAPTAEAPLFAVPDHFPPPHYPVDVTTMSKKTVELGRQLFYDPILSVDNSISCGSCHHQKNAFSDRELKVSQGVDGTPGTRNTPTLSNLAWYPYFMADGGVNHLEVVPLVPITSDIEMKQDLLGLIKKINQNDHYRTAFKVAFNSDSITSQLLLLALTHFQLTFISSDSKYDQYVSGKTDLSAIEQEGCQIFEQNCAQCHKPPLFTDFSFVNTGIDLHYTDPGRSRISLDTKDSGAFKVPSLRNIALTAPYMHDGRFNSLDEVLEHHGIDIADVKRVDPRMKSMENLSDTEKQSLVAFLGALTDAKFINNNRLSN